MATVEIHNQRMKQAVKDAFSQLSRDTSLSLSEYSYISQCHHNVHAALARRINNFTTVLPGAFARHTMISPLAGSIIDMFVLFKHEQMIGSSPKKLVAKFKSILSEHYPECWIAKRTKAVILRVDNFVFRIQPGFLTDQSYYMMPSRTRDDWERYDAVGYKHAFAKLNAGHKGKLVHVIRMMKTWNRLTGSLFDSYYLECMVAQLLKDYEIENYDDAICEIFRSMVKQAAFRVTDPACVSIDIDGLRNVDDLIRAIKLVHIAYQTAKQAIEFTEETPSPVALNNWEKLFPGVWQHAY